jgi:hypothetical protein
MATVPETRRSPAVEPLSSSMEAVGEPPALPVASGSVAAPAAASTLTLTIADTPKVHADEPSAGPAAGAPPPALSLDGLGATGITGAAPPAGVTPVLAPLSVRRATSSLPSVRRVIRTLFGSESGFGSVAPAGGGPGGGGGGAGGPGPNGAGDPTANCVVVATLSPGDVFNEFGLFFADDTATATAAQDAAASPKDEKTAGAASASAAGAETGPAAEVKTAGTPTRAAEAALLRALTTDPAAAATSDGSYLAVAVQPVVVRALSVSDLRAVERTDPAFALRVHRLLTESVIRRWAATTDILTNL